MARILVSGLINIETTLRVDGFPVSYGPVHYAFDRVHSSVSGVGFNVAKALRTLGHDVVFLSLIGRDAAGDLVRGALHACDVNDAFVRSDLAATPQSVILYDGQGRRQIHVDLKDVQERVYPTAEFDRALAGCQASALCNINFSRPFLARARAAGVRVATDVHTLSSLEDAYNQDFLAYADILFMSGDALPQSPDGWAADVMRRHHPEVLVIGLGADGAWLQTRDGTARRVPAVAATPVNTIGAGDALFSSFLHGYLLDGNATRALQDAVVFAAHKIGATSASSGFLTHDELREASQRAYRG